MKSPTASGMRTTAPFERYSGSKRPSSQGIPEAIPESMMFQTIGIIVGITGADLPDQRCCRRRSRYGLGQKSLTLSPFFGNEELSILILRR